MTIDIEPLKKELGRKIEDEDVVTQAPLKAMIAVPNIANAAPATWSARRIIYLSLAADRNHRFVGTLAVYVPECLEIRPIEIG